MIMKAPPSKALIIKINLVFLACFFVAYAAIILSHSSYNTVYHHQNTLSLAKCSLRKCHHKVEGGIKMKVVLEKPVRNETKAEKKLMVKREKPSFLDEMGRGMQIGMVNMDDEDVTEWKMHGEMTQVHFQKVSDLFEWKDLFPEWIDEEEETDGPTCPEMPMPLFKTYGYMDMIVVKLPCGKRDVFRLQVHLVAANLAVKRGTRGWNKKVKVVFLSKRRPMVELFRCDNLKKHEGDWWYYEPDMVKLHQKVSLPIGSCNLALPLWGKEINKVYDVSNIEKISSKTTKREAYATVLHSSEAYVCGAITLAQSLVQTGTKRDLILLLDKSISKPKQEALIKAGWKLKFIKRIRNPKAEKNTYNEYNYSKFRLWQLIDYNKIIFIDSDIIVLRNMDVLFYFPQMSATGNDGSIFNSGVMVIEPSNCTFRMFMQRREEVVSYNGGDQGFLNEVFVWWHRLPRRVNFLKNFWSNSSNEVSVKNQLFGAEPPKLYAIHYLGLKPWLCYRDYDCNWDISDQRVYASDVAHRTWWKLHDAMDKSLHKFCGLTKRRKIELEWGRKKAGKMGFKDEHRRINVTDPRQFS
ncbi:UDP-glucuronate:xylan alpha-glucuronosyltransferase 2-like [Lycium ferocissimum]|uniref:UDP-glucuronate:xylan alpha-glucuronosyltransferase 2-like n=1 Tax=Lycium ferocissimum TaxID=112874 RepID=UPI0028160B6B|nr:UDP-glucuronate:xylan alpha-glucuronosyltransferase 2-like [Lycium ferocissimum]